jgi:hypothetical protein
MLLIMAQATTIRLVQPQDVKNGQCAVCGGKTDLKWLDTELGLVGECCKNAAIQADHLLQTANFLRPSK